MSLKLSEQHAKQTAAQAAQAVLAAHQPEPIPLFGTMAEALLELQPTDPTTEEQDGHDLGLEPRSGAETDASGNSAQKHSL